MVTAAFYIALPLLTWRLLDLLEEIIIGPIKMSLDRWVITGPPAMALQVLIITALLFATLAPPVLWLLRQGKSPWIDNPRQWFAICNSNGNKFAVCNTCSPQSSL